jgi:uncharacterized protein YjdB
MTRVHKGLTMGGALSRMLLAATATAAIAAAGCGGYGINLRSGGSGADNPTEVAIEAASGVTINPYPVEIGHTTLFVAHPSSGNSLNYGVDQPVMWNSSQPALVGLLESDCQTPYGGEPAETICVSGFAKGSSTINATTGNGAVGSIVVTVTI